MADAKIVRQRLRELLPTVDLETATQRSILHRLQEELGVPLDAHKPLIKEEIDTFLSEQQDAEDDDDSDFEAETAPPAAKKQRGEGGTAKPAAGSLAPAPGELVVQLSAKRYATVRRYNGRLMADVREYYEKDGQLAPSQRGLALQPPAWSTLAGQLEALGQALDERNDAFFVDLGGSKRAAVSSYKGRYSVDLREYYEKDGQMLPGKKGVALSAQEWAALCDAAPQISKQLAAMGGSGAASGPAAAAAAAGPGPGPSSAAAGSSAAAAAGSAAGGAAAAAGGVDLSSTRRADVSSFKGTVYVNIREYYEKDGQKLPGKKGISLPADQFAKLRDGAQQLDEALHSRNTDFEVQLSGKRRASVSAFKGRYLVNIREYYEKDGQMLPGQKGISLPEDQWGKLLSGLPGLQAALEAGK